MKKIIVISLFVITFLVQSFERPLNEFQLAELIMRERQHCIFCAGICCGALCCAAEKPLCVLIGVACCVSGCVGNEAMEKRIQAHKAACITQQPLK